MSNSKIFFCVFVFMIAAVGLSGCNQATQSPPAGWYRLKVEKITEFDDLVIAKLNIEFAGEYTVAVVEPNGSSSYLVQPNRETGISTCDVLLFANLMTFGKEKNKEKRLKWLAQIRCNGGLAGGPSTIQLSDDKTLNELFQLQIKSGEYAMGLEQELAIFRDEVLILKVGK